MLLFTRRRFQFWSGSVGNRNPENVVALQTDSPVQFCSVLIRKTFHSSWVSVRACIHIYMTNQFIYCSSFDSEPEQPSVIFGQPLQKLLPQDQVKNHSGSSTPVPSPQPRNLTVNGAASVSPTSTSSDASYHLDIEPNPTSALLEVLVDNLPPSPKAQRRMSLCPADPQVPDIVRKAIHYLDTKGVKTEGIFRIPGAKTRIDEVWSAMILCYGVGLRASQLSWLCFKCQVISVMWYSACYRQPSKLQAIHRPTQCAFYCW